MTAATTATTGASTGWPDSDSPSSTAGPMSDTPASSMSRDRVVRGAAVGLGWDSSRIEGCRAAAPQQA